MSYRLLSEFTVTLVGVYHLPEGTNIFTWWLTSRVRVTWVWRVTFQLRIFIIHIFCVGNLDDWMNETSDVFFVKDTVVFFYWISFRTFSKTILKKQIQKAMFQKSPDFIQQSLDLCVSWSLRDKKTLVVLRGEGLEMGFVFLVYPRKVTKGSRIASFPIVFQWQAMKLRGCNGRGGVEFPLRKARQTCKIAFHHAAVADFHVS